MARSYTPEQREAARPLYEQHGPAEAARLMTERGVEVKRATVSRWAKRYGWQTERKANTEAAVAAAQASRGPKRERVIALALLTAERKLEQAYESSDAKASYYLTGAADKALRNFLTMTGEATSRTGIEDDSEALRRLLEQANQRIERDDLAKRRERKTAAA